MAQLIINLQSVMEPLFGHSSPHQSIFETILEACSHSHIEVEEENSNEHLHFACKQEILPEEREENEPNAWFFMEETPFDSLLENKDTSKQDIKLEFKRLKSLREQQETKIASFLRQDKYKSLRDIEVPSKDDSPTGKSTQSLSPRKTKKIDKGKPLKLVLEFD